MGILFSFFTIMLVWSISIQRLVAGEKLECDLWRVFKVTGNIRILAHIHSPLIDILIRPPGPNIRLSINVHICFPTSYVYRIYIESSIMHGPAFPSRNGRFNRLCSHQDQELSRSDPHTRTSHVNLLLIIIF